MTDPDEFYPVNTIPVLARALELYFKTGGKFKEGGVLELIFPAGKHKEMMRTKGEHEIIIWLSKQQLFVRARCSFDKDCSFNTPRFDAKDRDALKPLPWDLMNDRTFFVALRKWLFRLKFDFVTIIRALNTAADRYVEIPLTTKWGPTFSIKLSSETIHPSETEGKVPHLLFTPNLEDPSVRIEAVNKYLPL